MAISKTLLAALRAISYDPDVKKNYEPMRRLLRATHPKALPIDYREWSHKVICGGREVPVRLFTPVDSFARPMIVFFHGGGWVTGDVDSYNKVCANLCRNTNRIVVSVDYALAPEYKFPLGLEECYAVTKEIFLDTQGLFSIDKNDITLMGDSAGGNLAAAVSLMARDRGDFLPYNQILIYPATGADHSLKTSPYESVRENGTDYLLTAKRICDYMELYRSSPEDEKSPYYAPVLSEDLSNQPRTLVLTAQFDPLRDEGELYGKRLQEAGNDVTILRVPDALHGYFSLPLTFQIVRETFVAINHFLNYNPMPEGLFSASTEDQSL